MVRNGVAFLTLAERKYPQKLAFLYLQDIADSFMDELKNTYGTTGGIDYQSKIEIIDNQYAFLKFGIHSIHSYKYVIREGDKQKEEGVQGFKCKGKH